jgi:hypothetical protein
LAALDLAIERRGHAGEVADHDSSSPVSLASATVENGPSDPDVVSSGDVIAVAERLPDHLAVVIGDQARRIDGAAVRLRRWRQDDVGRRPDPRLVIDAKQEKNYRPDTKKRFRY